MPNFKYEIATEVSDNDCRPTFPRIPILGFLPAKNGRLHGEIEKIAGGDCRDCRDCCDCREGRFWQHWLMLPEIAGFTDIAEFAG